MPRPAPLNPTPLGLLTPLYLPQDFFFDDLIAFAVLIFDADHESVWVHSPSGGTPTKRMPASIGTGPITIDLSMPLDGDMSSDALSNRRMRSGGKLVAELRFEEHA